MQIDNQDSKIAQLDLLYGICDCVQKNEVNLIIAYRTHRCIKNRRPVIIKYIPIFLLFGHVLDCNINR